MQKNFLLLIWLLLFTAFSAVAQSPSLNGVYVGAQLYNTPFNGMQINNIVVYFRNNGTLTNELNRTDWKTRVSGSYTIQNNMVQLMFTNGFENARYKLAANGNLVSTAGIQHTLHKVKPVTTLPASGYERKTASSQGGMGTGMPAIGAFSSNHLYFDGKGQFSFNHEGIVGIGGDVTGGTIGSKQENNRSTSGTYQLENGGITLTFKDGKVSKHSFFYSPPAEEDLILLDGEFYFREEASEKTATAKEKTDTGKQGTTPKETDLPAAADLLGKLRAQYGGTNIDNITTVKETSSITGNLQAVSLTDIVHNKIRVEIRQGGKLLLVKQLAGNEGWQWVNGAKKPLTADEKSELKLSLYQGILGLHKKLSSYLQSGTVSRSGDDYLLTFLVNNQQLVYLVGSDYTLKANAYSINEVRNYSVYKDFVKTNGITYPTLTESSDGKTTIAINSTKTEFNPVLTDADWQTP